MIFGDVVNISIIYRIPDSCTGLKTISKGIMDSVATVYLYIYLPDVYICYNNKGERAVSFYQERTKLYMFVKKASPDSKIDTQCGIFFKTSGTNVA